MNRVIYIAVPIIVAALVIIAYVTPFNAEPYRSENVLATTTITIPTPFVVTHIKTPVPLKAIYMSSWVAGSPKLREKLINLMDATEINAVVMDIKDYTGRISFKVDNPELQAYGSVENRIPDIKELIGRLHEKGIYVIGRISSFQDSYLVHSKLQYAVTDKAGKLWKDHKGISWLDVSAKPVWDYLALIGNEAYAFGFDELNFDYIRFPSDGNMEDIAFPYTQTKSKPDALRDFFAYLDTTFHAKNIPISADVFGMTTSSNNDLGIGQVLGNALIHFDYVAPMVYPSHYPNNFLGYPKPAAKPYEVIKYAMESGIKKADLASTTATKLRPWLQDFSIGGVEYTPEMVRAQIKATYDVGLTSWMLWNASNVYTASALEAASSTVHN